VCEPAVPTPSRELGSTETPKPMPPPGFMPVERSQLPVPPSAPNGSCPTCGTPPPEHGDAIFALCPRCKTGYDASSSAVPDPENAVVIP
jgi:hypothetical protein